MSLLDDINLLLRDHTGYTGDGQGGSGPLPVGDRSTARFPINKRDLRELLIGIAQAMGDPGALQDIIDELGDKADIANSGKVFTNRAAAVSAGQTNLPGALGLIFTVEGANNETLAVRSFSNASDDPLFETAPRWGVAMRVPNRALLDDKADQTELDARIPQTEATAGLVPVVVTETGQTAIWLTGGDIDGRGMAKGLRQDAVKDIVSRQNQGVGTPLITAGEKVIAWLDAAGRFSAVGLRAEEAPLTQAQPRQQPLGSDVPIATDGRTLHRLRRKIGLIRAGVAGQKLRIAMTGDSWSELVNIPNALIDLLSDRVAPAAGSFVQANTANMWSGVSLTASAGWTRQDASVNSDWPYGTGPDGQVYHTTDTGETLSISGVEGASLRIYTRAWGGAWEYSLNGGTPVGVSEPDDAGALTVTEVSGLTAGANSLTITTTGGAGPVVFCGLLNVRSEAVEVAKVGNGGLTGYRLRDYAPLVDDVWLDIDPDLVVLNLGTNDYRNGYSTVATYVDGLTQGLATIRAAAPDAGVIIVVPPQSDGVAITPLSSYRDAAYTFAIENGCEFLNCLDSWGDYGGGLWADTLHLNPSGAAVIADQFNHHFIGA